MEWKIFFEKVAKAGYDGIEFGVANTEAEGQLDLVWGLAEKYNLKIIAQCYDTREADFTKHFDLYAGWFEKIRPYPVVKINSQTGRDFFSFEKNRALVDLAGRFTQETGIEVLHETHRNKMLFAAHLSKGYLERIPDMKLTFDVSHWVCVAESFLEDQDAAVQLSIERADHIHARVGYIEGPQVSDPRVGEWCYALAVHLSWWDRIVDLKKLKKEPLTITPEFGPHPYMVNLPGSKTPLANQWDVNEFMMNLLKKRHDHDANR